MARSGDKIHGKPVIERERSRHALVGWMRSINRRGFPAAVAFAAIGAQMALAGDAAIVRLAGTMTQDNFLPVAALMTHSADGFVGLKMLVSSKHGISVKEDNGRLAIEAPGSGVRLEVESGFRSDDRGHFLEGFYKVKDEGVRNQVATIAVTPVRSMDVEATGRPVKLVQIDKLKPGASD